MHTSEGFCKPLGLLALGLSMSCVFVLNCVYTCFLFCQVVAMAKSVSFSGYMAVGKEEVS